MKKIALAVGGLACALAAAMASEPQDHYRFAIPGRGWSVGFSLSPLDRYMATTKRGDFQFQGATSEGTTLSFFVEFTRAASSSDACRTKYWKDASRNPMIDQATVRPLTIGNLAAVEYVLEGEIEGNYVKAQHLNVYVAHDESCIDFHVSRYPFSQRDALRLRQIAESLVIGP